MLDLIFLRLEVLNAKGNLKSAAEEGKGEFVGAYCLAVGGLNPGELVRGPTSEMILTSRDGM